MNLARLSYHAKDRLLQKVAEYIEERETARGYADQLNRNAAREVYAEIELLNRAQAYKLEKAIMEKEDYDPAADKWGFGPVVVSPVNYCYHVWVKEGA